MLWLSEKYRKYKLKIFQKDDKYYTFNMYYFQDNTNVCD